MKSTKKFNVQICYRSIDEPLQKTVTYHCADIAKDYLTDLYKNKVTGECPYIVIEEMINENRRRVKNRCYKN